MPQRMPPIARIRLARSVPRLLLAPVIFGVAGATAMTAGLLFTAGATGFALAVLGGLLVVGAAGAGLVLLSVRLEVEESAVGVTWLGGERIYPLTPGPVTRVRLRGENASRLRARSGAFGWGIGRARLRDDEEIEVVRLAPTDTAILVPTERGRLAVAPADDDELLDALSRAARARQRLESISEAAPEAPEAEQRHEEPDEAPPAVELQPHALTGIERALLEERLASERAAIEAADAGAEPVVPPPAEPMPPAPAERRRRVSVPRPRIPRPALHRPPARAAFVLLPIAGAGIAWGAGVVMGRMPPPGTDLARLTALALVLAGPAASVGAIMALAWWPRLVGVVIAGGLAASVLIGRALVGG